MKPGGRNAEVAASAASREPAGYQVSDLQVDVRTRRVFRDGVDLEVTSLSFDLLLALARASPGLVVFDDLMQQVWPGVVVSPETLTQRVKLLRQALADNADQPRYILAVRGHGYRLLVPAVSQSAALVSPETPAAMGSRAWPRRQRWAVAALALICVASASMWILSLHDAEVTPGDTAEAYRFFEQAESVVNGTPESFRAAIALYDEALARDPQFARALSGRAMNRAALVWVGSPLGRGLEDAQRDAEQSLALDPADARAHTVLASMAAMRGQWSAAEGGFVSAIASSPQDADVRARYAVTLLLSTGQLRKAAAEASHAQGLAPGSSFPAAALAFADQALGADEQAVKFAQLSQARGGDPRQMVPVHASAAARRGQYDEAASHAIQMLPPAIRDAGGEATLRLAYLSLGDPARQPAALGALRSLTHAPAWQQADPRARQLVLYLFAALGAMDDLYAEMEGMLRGATYPQIIAVGELWAPQMRAFRQDRRFQPLVERLGLMAYWKEHGPPDGCRLAGATLICS